MVYKMTQNKWEFVDCNLCNSTDYSDLYKVGSHCIVKCSKCGLVYENPRPTIQELQNSNLSIYASNEYEQMYLDYRELLSERFHKRLTEIGQWVSSGGRLMDIGCSFGLFLKIAESFDIWECMGVEVNEKTAEYARGRLGLNVVTGQLGHLKFPSGHFDVVTMWDVLEHTPDPYSYLWEVRRILKDNGLVAIQLPNIESFLARLGREQWEWLTPPDHLYHFSPATLQAILKKAGFKVLKIKTEEPSKIFINSILSRWTFTGPTHPIKAVVTKIIKRVHFAFLPFQWINWWRGKGALIVTYAKPATMHK